MILLILAPVFTKSMLDYNETLTKEVVSVTLTKEQREELLKEIREASEEVKKRNDDKNSAYLKLGSAYERMGYRAKAVSAYKEVLEMDTMNVSALVSLASLQEKMEQEEEAENSYKRLVEIQPNARNYNLLAGFVLQRKNDVSSARALYLEGLQKTNSDTLLMKYFASFLESIGDRYEAYLYWDAVYRRESSNTEVKNNVERLKVIEADVIKATEKVK